ncbi:MAG: DUF1330 domain-containing protein [bacterium]|nr:DUF1330 domain-containing protein [bacterium]
MLVRNALLPTGDQLSAVAADGRDVPIVMLNLLKFHPRAQYPDGRDAHLTGEEAYQRYADLMVPFVESRGGRLLYQGRALGVVLGEVEEPWDLVGLVQYPSPRVFVEIATSAEVHGFGVHREAGLAGQLLVMLEPRA